MRLRPFLIALPSLGARLRIARSFSAIPPAFETLSLSRPSEHVAVLSLNRPDKANSMNKRMWAELTAAFQSLGSLEDPSRAIILRGSGKFFTAGLDLSDHADLFLSSGGEGGPACVGRRAWRLRELILSYQASLSSLSACPKPVIAAVHGACVGGGVDLVCAADVRFASADAFFCIKEAEIGMVADVGTLQRMPKIVGNDSLVRELAFTARRFGADEALRHGFLSAVLCDSAELFAHALATATRIASLSPLAVQGTKLNLNFSRDHSVDSGLQFNAAWNMGMLQSQDLPIAVAASVGGKKAAPPVFPDVRLK